MDNKLSVWTIERLTKRKKLLTWSSTIVFCCLLIILISGTYLALVHGKYQQLGMTGVFAIMFISMKNQLQRIQTELQSRTAI